MSRALSISRGHPSWATKARSLTNELFIVRTVIDHSTPVEPSLSYSPRLRYGLVVKRKIGCAVLRNRIKRRLREAFALLDVSRLTTTADVAYIVVVRQAAVAEMPFLDVCHHLKGLLKFYD